MKKKMPILSRLLVVMYQKHMGHVDRVDKNVSLSRLRLKRCMKRYHRAIFLWYMAIVLNNIIVLFDLLFSDVVNLWRAKGRLDYKHWFQNALGNALIEYATRRAKELIAEAFAARTSDMTAPSDSPVTSQHTPTVTTSVLRDRTNAVDSDRPRRSGRPIKRKRGGGRPSAAKKVSPTHTHTHTS
jgi:hypothetical protein